MQHNSMISADRIDRAAVECLLARMELTPSRRLAWDDLREAKESPGFSRGEDVKHWLDPADVKGIAGRLEARQGGTR